MYLTNACTSMKMQLMYSLKEVNAAYSVSQVLILISLAQQLPDRIQMYYICQKFIYSYGSF